MAVVLVFLDGVGLGARDPAINPLARRTGLLSQFRGGDGVPLPRGGARRGLDATLGVAGRPQSATGQTALYTGENAPALLGRHLVGFPNAALRDLLARRSLFRRLADAGARVALANGYPAVYLDALGVAHRPLVGPPEPALPAAARRLKPAAGLFAVVSAGLPVATFDDVRAGRALTHDVTGASARTRLPGLVPERTPEEAAAVLASRAATLDFCLFESFLLDAAGHARDFAAAQEALGSLDRFLRRLLDLLPAGHSLLVTSDHGNVEDLRTRSHTRADVPLLVFGPLAARPLPARLTGVADLVLGGVLA